jgi:ribose transport system ATP-binding protein
VAASRPMIEVSGLEKRFGGQVALAGVDLQLLPGEVHALLGENGAGKSTLIKILAGVVKPDAGEIAINGRTLPRHHGAAEAAAAGLAFVHQDLGLIESLSIAENIALSNGYASRGPFISHRETRRRAAEVLSALEIELDPATMVGELTHDRRVMVAVARAFSSQARAIVLDEISSSLPPPEVAALAAWLRQSRREGLGYVYVTHRLDEVLEIADRVTVLRDGTRIVTTPTAGLSIEDLVTWITGAAALEPAPRQRGDGDDVPFAARLRVEGLMGRGLSEPLTFEAAPGEIVAFCGLVGSGSRELAALLAGAARPRAGAAWLGAERLPLGSPAGLREAGCEYVPGDRQGAGALLTLTVRENLFPVLRRGDDVTAGLLRRRGERHRAAELVERFDVRPRATERPLSAFSGGNQQKVVFARSIHRQPRLLVVDDPTAGVDVGARVQLHDCLVEAAASGSVVVVASTDFQEVAAVADRAFVLWRGRVVATLVGEDLNEQRLFGGSYGLQRDGEEVRT